MLFEKLFRTESIFKIAFFYSLLEFYINSRMIRLLIKEGLALNDDLLVLGVCLVLFV